MVVERHRYLCFTWSELVFDKQQDPRDEHDLSHDEALRERLRGRFIEHLREEHHADLIDGRLRNEQRQPRSDSELRAANPLGWRGALRF
jgi:hypothetical protein